MLDINFELAMANDLSMDDLVLIRYIDLSVEEIGDTLNGEAIISYEKVIEELPIVFNSNSRGSNVKKHRNMLNKEGVKKFITRETKQLGRGKGATTKFKVDKPNIDKLKLGKLLI